MLNSINYRCMHFVVIALVAALQSCDKNEDSPTPTRKIGEKHAGGIIFYIDNSGQHGLVCSESDVGNQGFARWDNKENSFTKTSATSTAIGTGKDNTAKIVNTLDYPIPLGETAYAAKLCDDLTLNANSDWFLPSRDELKLIYDNLKTKGIGNFPMKSIGALLNMIHGMHSCIFYEW